ncbi:Alpha/Beta hydrolase protein [Diplogelasinospora grovesii]|uniref:Alpha/Beta hydrolase protein n=1 Tax=Diplogelasinospora grovesii TaxID=303347 RepID=A0AAN6NE34_9PEZI|nr:Alpha/Beta hydrolase protein [Diplogelasinospora grovesii]
MCPPKLKRVLSKRALLWAWLSFLFLVLLYFYHDLSAISESPYNPLRLIIGEDDRHTTTTTPELGNAGTTGTAGGAKNTHTQPTYTQPKPTTVVVQGNTPTTTMDGGGGGGRPTVALRQGRYVGVKLDASNRFPKPLEAFRGVPFARSTAGQNRFRPAQVLPESNGTYEASVFGIACPVMGVVKEGYGEDCLNANIYRPAGLVDQDGYYYVASDGGERRRAKLPVAVYVHGGGFNGGVGIERNMASFIAWTDSPMIGINFNYRVGALGFLPSALTAKEGLLNLGIKDQQLLFEWVQQNVEAFGGDPENVTIMGLSAGAHSIGHHVMYYSQLPGPAPFAKAIMESGATTARAVFHPTHPRHLVQFREFLIAAGVEGVPEEKVFDTLRELPLQTIVSASKAVWDKYEESVTWPFQPVIDGPNSLSNSTTTTIRTNDSLPVIPDLPINSWIKGRHLKVPMIVGFNTNEGTQFIPAKANTNEEFRAFFKGLIPSFSDADLDELERLYPDPVTNPKSPYKSVLPGEGKQWMRLDAAYSHYAYICPVLQTAHFINTCNNNTEGQQAPPVYVYRYAATSAWGTANHGDEAPVVAHDMDVLGRGGKHGGPMQGLCAVSDAMHGAWARFVVSTSGNPNVDGVDPKIRDVIEWPAFETPFGRDEAWTYSKEEGVKGRRWWWDHTDKGGGSKKVGGGKGRLLVFGEGNDERRGREGWRRKGTPAKVSALTEGELAACRFWWPRVVLSEGLGNKKVAAGGGGGGVWAEVMRRAKL